MTEKVKIKSTKLIENDKGGYLEVTLDDGREGRSYDKRLKPQQDIELVISRDKEFPNEEKYFFVKPLPKTTPYKSQDKLPKIPLEPTVSKVKPTTSQVNTFTEREQALSHAITLYQTGDIHLDNNVDPVTGVIQTAEQLLEWLNKNN